MGKPKWLIPARNVLTPGFFDIHMHGGAGVDAMRASGPSFPGWENF